MRSLAGWGGCIALGAGLRFAQLTTKPLWTDEFATIVFSLGNSFQTVPLDRLVTVDQLLFPLRPDPTATVGSVVHYLLTESNHPPLYYILTHFWLKLFPTQDGWVSVGGARSLSALFGVVAIPAIFGLAWVAFRAVSVARSAALLMALSPFAVYLSLEARHYTLAIVWIVASLTCLVVVVQSLWNYTAPSLTVCLLWVGVNGLGVATHYFVALTLVAEAIVLLGVAGLQLGQKGLSSGWWRVGIAVVGTIAAGLVWLPFLSTIQDSALTQWVSPDEDDFSWQTPLVQSIAGWITMLYLAPIQATVPWVRQLAAVGLAGITAYTIPAICRGLSDRTLLKPQSVRLLGGFVLAAIALFWGITYGAGMDLTVAFRYNFVFFPAVIVLLAAGAGALWERSPHVSRWYLRRSSLILMGLVSLLGAVTVVTNLSYQKTHQPNRVVDAIQANSQFPVIVAIAHETHGQTGRLMGIAWEFQRRLEKDPTIAMPRFLLAHQGSEDPTPAYAALQRTLDTLPRPLDVWLLNFRSPLNTGRRQVLNPQGCRVRSERTVVDGYKYQLYRCSVEKSD
ncbi:MAG: glycosyltransferase [Leptolyngbyaceae cyanobacterium SL_7_1]|nr:glycosyltransferase [Leptolyngbyaceae cyanobacterium SL_7_1]